MTEDQPKDRILQAAGRIFADHGYECATIRSICALARVNVASVNYYFGDKSNLYIEAVLHAHRCRVVEISIDPQAKPAELLRAYIRDFLGKILAVAEEGDWTKRLMLREMMSPSVATETLVRDAIRPRYEQLQTILRRICPDAEPRRLHAIAFSVIGQCMHYRLVPHIAGRLASDLSEGEFDEGFLIDHISSFTLAALGLAPPIGPCGRCSELPSPRKAKGSR